MALVRITDVDAYLTHLETTSSEVINLHDDLLIHVTRFFREPQAFDALATEVLPELVADMSPQSPIRVWVAGCSTGEEAYSLAMVLIEALGARSPDARIQIFGTDLSDGAIDFARHGVYPPSIAADMSPERLQKFFTKSNGSYRVSKSVRDLCVFARQDLTRDPPFSRLDIVCCRNVLIYMDSSFQKKLLSIFHYALKPRGVLLLGHAESIGYNSELFTVMDKKHRIHRRKPGAMPGGVEVRMAPPSLKSELSTKAAADARANTRVVLNEANRIVLDRFAPPSVLVDQNFHAVQFNGQTGLYLEPSPGEPSFHVLKLAREGLLHGLRTALQAAKKSRRPVRRQALRVRNGAEWHDVDIEVIPMIQQSQTYFLVLFDGRLPEKKGEGRRLKADKGSRRAGAEEHRLAKLEEELAATREYLQSTVQEIEAANEELQSANEEILSSNEELQSTNEELDTAKEELQSANEELNTVNDELHGRNEELTRANADLVNLLSSVQIAIVIVSSDLRIRLFTPMAEKLLNLIPTDMGRPFSQISSNIAVSDLPALIAETIEQVTPVERDVQDSQGRWYSLRVRPYKGSENRIEGAVIVLFDIDAAKRYAQQMNRSDA
jgi:two-component system CheB/CheR fusion protein